MKMKTRTIVLAIVGMLAFISISCYASETSWSAEGTPSGNLRQVVGLPSVAVGNLNPSARNPGVEVFCTALYDAPGGYCYYFTLGLPYTNYTVASNMTIGGTR
jgi:hypothetical protein